MGKRSDFERIERDNYETPAAAVLPLLSHLEPATRFVEPCCGAGLLAGHLKRAGHILVGAYDLPTDARIHQYDIEAGAVFVSNPPGWGRPKVLHPIIENLSDQAPTWLLMPGNWVWNLSSALLDLRARMVVPVGRAQWIEGSEHSSKDDAAWFLFGQIDIANRTHLARARADQLGIGSPPRHRAFAGGRSRFVAASEPWRRYERKTRPR
jgi:hypothetical protein